MNAVGAKFGEICHALEIGPVELSDEMKVGNRALFRVKISDDEKQRKLLMVANKLKSMEGYEIVYVQKDLIYRQRKEFIVRRHQASTGEDCGQTSISMDQRGLFSTDM